MYQTYVFCGFVMHLIFMYYRELWVYVLYHDFGWCLRPCYDAWGCVTCDLCVLILLLLLLHPCAAYNFGAKANNHL